MKGTTLHEPPVDTLLQPEKAETAAQPKLKEEKRIHERIRDQVTGGIGGLLGKISPLASLKERFPKITKVTSAIREGIDKLIGLLSGKKGTKGAPQSPPPSSDMSVSDITGEPSLKAYTGKAPEVTKAYQNADKAEQEHMDNLAFQFGELQNNYRRALKHEHDELVMGTPALSVNQELMNLAGTIAGKQAQQGYCEHTSDEYRKGNNIQGEILVSGFSTAREALQEFIDSKEHYHYLAGNFKEVGYAIRSGVEKKSGAKTYYLVVLFRGGHEQYEKPPVVDIPGQEEVREPVSGTTVKECIGNRPALKAHFAALAAELKHHPDISYELNQTVTGNMQKKKKFRGNFAITMRKGDKYKHYMVSDRPSVFQRSEMIGDKPKIFQVQFSNVLQDFENMTKKPEMPAEELERHGALEPQEPKLKETEEESPAEDLPELE